MKMKFLNHLLAIDKPVIFLILLTLALVSGCDSTLDPIKERADSYSIYGVLDLQTTPNFIRVNDNNALLTPESTKELDVEILVRDMTENSTRSLRDSVVLFDSVYTHNFIYDEPIRFNARYLITLENNTGYRDSLISIVPAETGLTLSNREVFCEQPFSVELSNIDLDAGEKVIAEAGLELRGKWHWARAVLGGSYNPDENTLSFGWTPYGISYSLFSSPISDPPYCDELSKDFVRLRFTHIGFMEGGKALGESFIEPDGDFSLARKVVLSKYVAEAQVNILPDNGESQPAMEE